GAKIKMVNGYPGTNEIQLATERGEVDGLCGLSWSTLKGRYPHWLTGNKKANILVQAGIKTQPELPDVPSASELAKQADQRQILKLMLIGQAMARPFAAPPGIPADRKAALIAAFERTTKDPDFLAEAERLNLEVNPVHADKLGALLAEAYAMPKDVIAKAAKAMSDYAAVSGRKVHKAPGCEMHARSRHEWIDWSAYSSPRGRRPASRQGAL